MPARKWIFTHAQFDILNPLLSSTAEILILHRTSRAKFQSFYSWINPCKKWGGSQFALLELLKQFCISWRIISELYTVGAKLYFFLPKKCWKFSIFMSDFSFINLFINLNFRAKNVSSLTMLLLKLFCSLDFCAKTTFSGFF